MVKRKHNCHLALYIFCPVTAFPYWVFSYAEKSAGRNYVRFIEYSIQPFVLLVKRKSYDFFYFVETDKSVTSLKSS